MIYKFSYGEHWKKLKLSGVDKPYGKLEAKTLSKSQERRYRSELAEKWHCLPEDIKLEEVEE